MTELKQRLDDLSNLLKEKKQTTNADELGIIERAITDTRKELQRFGIQDDTGTRLSELKQRVSENRRIDKRITRLQKQSEERIARLQAKKERVTQNPPGLLANKLKTFKSGVRRGKVLQQKETKAVQTELTKIIILNFPDCIAATLLTGQVVCTFDDRIDLRIELIERLYILHYIQEFSFILSSQF